MSAPITRVVDEMDDPSVLVRTVDRARALELARPVFDGLDMPGGRLDAGLPRLWRWIPANRRAGACDRMLHPWHRPGPGAFTAVMVYHHPDPQPRSEGKICNDDT